MGEVVAGIALPEGDPGTALATASGFRGAGSGFEASGGVTQRALSLVGSWQGVASVSFRDRCTGYEEAADTAQAACAHAAHAVQAYARELEDARERVRRLQREAEECLDRIAAAEARAAGAREREAAARSRATSAALSILDAGSYSLAEQTRAMDEAAAAAAEASAAESDAAAAREELERLKEEAERERERIKEAGRAAAGQVQAAAGQLPAVTYRASPAAAAAGQAAYAAYPGSLASPAWDGEEQDEEEEDKPWWQDAWDAATDVVCEGGEQLAGVGKGFAEGVVGIGEGGMMLYRLSPTNALIDRDSFEREWGNIGDAAEFAWDNPLEFGKAVINWEDLANGRYGEWAGNLGPDAAMAFATAGAGTAATATTRGLRAADTAGDVADAARDADRAADAARVGDRAPDSPGRLDSHIRDGHHDDLRAQAASVGVELPEPGMRVYRTYGEVEQVDGVLRGSRPWGESWTPVPPDRLANPRVELGLPEYNGGRYVITARLDDPASISQIRRALPWQGPDGYSQPGGAPEYLIPDAEDHLEILRVEGVNPEF